MPALKPRPAIADMVQYRPNITSPWRGRIIRLSSNEGALGPSPKAVEAMAAAADRLHRYARGEESALGPALATKYGLDPRRLVFGCGSDELIQTLCLAYVDPGDEVIHTQYGFVMYPVCTRIAGGVPVVAPDDGLTASVDAILDRVSDRTRIVFLANPNNPTGTYLPDAEIRRLHAGLPSRVLLVIDAAYAEYMARNDYTDGRELVERADNVVMLRTFSKLYGMAGLRLGWGYFPEHVADTVLAIKAPFSVTQTAVAAGAAALQDLEFEERSRAHNAQWLPWTQDRLREIGIDCLPTVANFFLMRFPDRADRSAEAARQHLSERGILLREMAGYGLPQHLRMSVGTGEEMEITVDRLAAFMRGD